MLNINFNNEEWALQGLNSQPLGMEAMILTWRTNSSFISNNILQTAIVLISECFSDKLYHTATNHRTSQVMNGHLLFSIRLNGQLYPDFVTLLQQGRKSSRHHNINIKVKRHPNGYWINFNLTFSTVSVDFIFISITCIPSP